MDTREAIDIVSKMFTLTLTILAPILGAGLMVGLTIAIFQSVTQIQEMTLTFIPKMLAMVMVLLYFMPWMFSKVIDFTREVFALIVPP
ncbi:MAG: flagellar biosynthesis protein FliQ [Planctomycetes bacterium]|nr:flagellar biosynthesis protein FliQ [Planctomycetota bacterium]